MMRKLTLLLVAVFGILFTSQAQYCGFDKLHNQLMASSPAFAARVNNLNSQLASMLANNSNSLIINTANGPVYEIPVVIHVIHTGGSVGTIYNPTDATLQGMITYLNQVYAATYASYPSATTGGTYFPVQFALAKRDPNCNASSTGINRVNGSSLSGYTANGVMHNGSVGASETAVKALSKWNNYDYYNIWVVNKIDGQDGTGSGPFVAGYAYYPGAGSALDGTIMLATQAVAGSITLPHEIGHAFSLMHVFQGDDPGNTGAATQCPVNANCATQGDMVCDTEPMQRSVFNCPSGTNPCTGVAWNNTQHNFMDYSNCQDRFTPGQKTRFINALTTTRASLISSLGATTLGTPPTAATCQPGINNPFTTADEGVFEVRLNDLVGTTEGGYNSDGAAVYLDRSCHQRANVQAGSTYTLSVQTGFNRSKVRVYMDYDNNGVFSASELVYSHDGSTGSAGSYEVHSGSITIPTTGVTTCVPIRMRVIADYYTPTSVITPCGNLDYGQAEDYSVVIRSAPTSVVTITQTAGTNPSCTGSTVGFTASYSGSPTNPSIKWYLNGVSTGVTTATYTSSTLANGAVLTAKLFYTGTCGPDSTVSAGFTVIRQATVTPTVSIAVSAGANPGCFGQSISFTATPTNGGSAPVYAWKVNGVTQPGITTATYTTTTLPCNSTVQAVLTSNSACASVTTVNSNIITYTCGPQTVSVAVAVTGGSNPTCAGRNVSFLATPTNGGTTPTYQWYLNGSPISGATGTTYSSSTLVNGDSVNVLLTSSSSCAATPTVFSPAIYMQVVPNITPLVTKSITVGSNPGCINDQIQFTANPTNGGISPTYRWYLNGTFVGGGSTYSNTTAVTGDRVWVRMIASGAGATCYTTDTAYSDTTSLVRLPVPNLPVISFIGGMLISDSANVQWYGPAGLLPGATGPTYHPTVIGQYYAQILNPLCGGGQSNILTISPLMIGNYNMTGVQLYPNPTTGLLTISWSTATTTRITVYTPAGQSVMHDVANVTTRKVVDMSRLANGVYFVVLQDESGKTGAVRVTVTH